MPVKDRRADIENVVSTIGFEKRTNFDELTGIDYSKQSSDLLKAFLLAKQPQTRRIEIEGVDVSFLYMPSTIGIQKKSGHFVTSSKGRVHLFMSRVSDLQTLYVRNTENIGVEGFVSMGAHTMQEIAFRNPEFRAFSNGLDMNSIARENIPAEFSPRGRIDDMHYTNKFMEPILRALDQASPQPFDTSFYSSSLVGMHQSFDESEYTIHLPSSMSESSFCSQIGVLQTDIERVVDFSASWKRENVQSLVNDISQERNARLSVLGLDIHHDFGEVTPPDYLYSEPVLNYIAGGHNAEVRKFRKEFVDRTYTLMFGSLEEARQLYKDCQFVSEIGLGRNIFEDVLTHHGRKDVEICDTIDNGRYPEKLLVEKFGFKNISKLQFRRAMEILGKGAASARHVSYQYGLRGLDAALALAKFPTDWFKVSADIPDLFTSLDPSLFSSRLSAAMPHLVYLGKERDRLSALGQIHEAKRITGQWSWLSQNDGLGILEKWGRLDEKYNVSSTYSDYTHLISQSMEVLLLRMMNDSSVPMPEDVVNFNEHLTTLEIDYELLSDTLRDSYAASDYTEHESLLKNNPDMVDDGFVSRWDNDVDDMTKITSSNISGYLFSSTSNFRELVELNQKWHTNVSALSKETNALDVQNNMVWVGLIDTPMLISDKFYIESINSRVDLLMEGIEMDHCAFSYLSRCLQGESILLSVKSIDGQRGATVELNPIAGSNPIYSIQQCFGYKNSPVSEELNQLVVSFVDRVNDRSVKSNPSPGGNQDAMDDVFEIVRENPLKYGYLIKETPYNTYAAHLTYFNLEQCLPKTASVSKMFSHVLGELGTKLMDSNNSFISEIQKIEQLSELTNIQPINLVRTAIAHGIRDFSDLEFKISELSTIELAIKKIRSDNPQLSNSQLAMKAADSLSDDGVGSYSVASLHEVFAHKSVLGGLMSIPLVDENTLNRECSHPLDTEVTTDLRNTMM